VGKIGYLFIDNGGVITDNAMVRQQWPPLVGEFFAPRLGGTLEAWARANRTTVPAAIERYSERMNAWDAASGDIMKEANRYSLDWLRSMCKEMEIAGPRSDAACAELAWQAEAWIRAQARTFFPGVEAAIRELAHTFTLFTASDGTSFQLAASLAALGLDSLFTSLYGPDLVNTPKQAPTYYERIFAHAGVGASSALVVDDSPEMLRRAQVTGAMTVLVSHDRKAGDGFAGVIESLADLPALLRDL
jgi:HAD superfamily hydrolase (TIGR01509 family)